MTIEAIKGIGVNRARAICDDCGRDEVVTCNYDGRPGHKTEPNEGQIIRKLTAQGWSYVRHQLRCPGCEAKRKAALAAKKEAVMAEVKEQSNVAPIREPDKNQKRLIVLALEDAYDSKAQRYRGEATDKTVAADLGAGIMPGWVAQLREEFFGPAGNEEAEAIRAEIEAVRAETGKKLDALTARLDALYRAEDKRVKA